jgi:hypothetical protein
MTTLSPSGRKVRLGKNMRASLEYAVRTPHKWHDIGKGRGARMAIRRLVKAGLVETRPAFNRFRIKH